MLLSMDVFIPIILIRWLYSYQIDEVRENYI